MNALHGFLLAAVALLSLLAGCKGATTEAPDAATTGAAKEYEIQGKVVAVGADKRSITLDHEEVPGLMKAMEMKFNVEEASVVEGVNAGDRVAGNLRVEGSDYTITRLKKR